MQYSFVCASVRARASGSSIQMISFAQLLNNVYWLNPKVVRLNQYLNYMYISVTTKKMIILMS